MKEDRVAVALHDARAALAPVLSNQPTDAEREILAPVLQALAAAESAVTERASAEVSISSSSIWAAPHDLLRERVAELEAALRARDDFIATIGHELKNPVTPVLLQVRQVHAAVSGAPSGVVATETLLPRLDSMLARLRRFLVTLNRILDVSRINSGRIDLNYEEIDLADIVRSTAADMEREVAASQSTLTVHADSPVVGWWDRLRLEQIVSNLLSNAVRYGLGNPIDIWVTDRGSTASLEVRDQGLGIAEQEQVVIFERFERGAGARTSGGFGVGLWVVKRLCAALGGSVEVQSRLEQGSTFTVTLPRDARES
jgi:signal transduction histidine kinase